MHNNVEKINKTNQSLPLTIGEAFAKYEQGGMSSVHSGYRSLLKSILQSNPSMKLDNDSYADALYLTDVMFQRTNKSIKMACGGGCGKFLSLLVESLRSCLERIKQNNGGVKVVIMAEEKPEILTKLESEFDSILEVKLASPNSSSPHFITCDDEAIRLEEPHEQITDDTEVTDVKAEVCFSDKPLAKLYSGGFDRAWENL